MFPRKDRLEDVEEMILQPRATEGDNHE
jgi:hypothetical protein